MSWYVACSLDQLLAEINQGAPGRSKASDGSIGDAAHAASESDHNPCDCHDAVCARDFTHDPGGGFDSYEFAEWLRKRCDAGQEHRVKYLISNRKIASADSGWNWTSYYGSNPHDHHVHVSVDHPVGTFDDDRSWEWEGDDVSAEQVWHWDIDASGEAAMSASHGLWLSQARTDYLANKWSVSTTNALNAMATDIDAIQAGLANAHTRLTGVETAVTEANTHAREQARGVQDLKLLVLVVLLVVVAGAAGIVAWAAATA